MKKIGMFFYGPLFPVSGGNQRVTGEIARYIHSLPDIELTLFIQAKKQPDLEKMYLQICDHLVWIAPPPRFGLWTFFNKIVARLGIDVWRSWFLSIYARKSLKSWVDKIDVLLLNYAAWAAVVPWKYRRQKTLAVTHDLIFYRRQSFEGTATCRKKFLLSLNRFFEIRLLKTFWRIGVFADYEKKLLLESGVPAPRIVKLGMPISVNDTASVSRQPETTPRKYDFLFVGGGSYQNTQGIITFLKRVAPLITARECVLAIVGGGRHVIDDMIIPKNFKMLQLGYVPSLQEVYSKSCIGVGTLPYGSGVKVKVVETMMNGLALIVISAVMRYENAPFDIYCRCCGIFFLFFGIWCLFPSCHLSYKWSGLSFPIYLIHLVILFLISTLYRNFAKVGICGYAIGVFVVVGLSILSIIALRHYCPRITAFLLGGR